ncbi:MAG: T9SS type A sorting domain-containing protein [Bacteroidota bacterium]
MRVLKYEWLCYCLFALLFVQTGNGQITIQKTDLQQAFVAGATLKFHFDTSQYINVGKTGGPNVYDFSSLTFPDSETYTLYSSSQIPQLAARFNPSSLVWGTSTQNISDSPVFFITDSGFVQLAQVSVYPDSQEYRYDTPYEEFLRFPATYNLQWSTSPGGAGVDTVYVNNVAPRVTTGWNSAETYSIDGYGTLLVHGMSYDCLRVRSVEVENFTYQGFNYFTKSGISFQVSSTKDQNDTGLVKVTGITFIKNENATLVSDDRVIPTTLSLSQNYPNPFNPSTLIEFSISKQDHVVLKVYDVLGRSVETLVDGVMSVGTHNVEWTPSNKESGVYFYRLQTNGATVVKKLLYLK